MFLLRLFISITVMLLFSHVLLSMDVGLTFTRRRPKSLLQRLSMSSATTESIKSTGNKKGQRKLSPELLSVLSKYEPVVGIEGGNVLPFNHHV